MKQMIFAGMACLIGLTFVPNANAQDDIYFSATKKQTKTQPTQSQMQIKAESLSKAAVYAETASDNWSTSANDDWDVDTYNRRGPSADDVYAPSTATSANELTIPAAALGNGLTGSDLGQSEVQYVHDTLYIVDAYTFSHRIRRFHNPRFAFYSYSPWYDVAYYDPYYWDYCYWDPWWYLTPSFGFSFGSWWGGWDFGYYNGWYGGWYSPYFRPHGHYYSNVWAYHGPTRHHYASHHHHGHFGGYHGMRNNFGGNFSNRRAAERRNGTMGINRNRSYHAGGTGSTRGAGNFSNRDGLTTRQRSAAAHSGMMGEARGAMTSGTTRNRSNNLTTRNSNLGTRNSATTGITTRGSSATGTTTRGANVTTRNSSTTTRSSSSTSNYSGSRSSSSSSSYRSGSSTTTTRGSSSSSYSGSRSSGSSSGGSRGGSSGGSSRGGGRR